MTALSFHRRSRRVAGFTLLEMMITLVVFVLLAAAIFGLLTGVLQSTAALQDNQNHHDEIAALNDYMKAQLGAMSSQSTIVSYIRGDGSGLTQNGILFGTITLATAIDATVQSNGYYTLRVTNLSAPAAGSASAPADARQLLLQSVSTDDPTLVWRNLIVDIKTLDWKFLDFNATDWVEVWNGPANPNLFEFTIQTGGATQLTTMDFWLPKLDTITLRLQRTQSTGGTTTPPARTGAPPTTPGAPGRTVPTPTH